MGWHVENAIVVEWPKINWMYFLLFKFLLLLFDTNQEVRTNVYICIFPIVFIFVDLMWTFLFYVCCRRNNRLKSWITFFFRGKVRKWQGKKSGINERFMSINSFFFFFYLSFVFMLLFMLNLYVGEDCFWQLKRIVRLS